MPFVTSQGVESCVFYHTLSKKWSKPRKGARGGGGCRLLISGQFIDKPVRHFVFGKNIRRKIYFFIFLFKHSRVPSGEREDIYTIQGVVVVVVRKCLLMLSHDSAALHLLDALEVDGGGIIHDESGGRSSSGLHLTKGTGGSDSLERLSSLAAAALCHRSHHRPLPPARIM